MIEVDRGLYCAHPSHSGYGQRQRECGQCGALPPDPREAGVVAALERLRGTEYEALPALEALLEEVRRG